MCVRERQRETEGWIHTTVEKSFIEIFTCYQSVICESVPSIFIEAPTLRLELTGIDLVPILRRLDLDTEYASAHPTARRTHAAVLIFTILIVLLLIICPWNGGEDVEVFVAWDEKAKEKVVFRIVTFFTSSLLGCLLLLPH